MYAASLYLGDDTSELERSESAEACLYRMGLDSCRDTRVGDQNFKGISGGQQKRLIVAMALVKRPLVLFVDEPTTGLDAAAAAHTTKYLMEMVEKENIIMVCVMHQPSAAMFETFQDLLVLAQGQPIFSGKASDAIPYFDRIGYPVQPGLSSPEFILDLVNADFSSDSQVMKIQDFYENPDTTPHTDDSLRASSSFRASSSLPVVPTSSSWHQFKTLLARDTILTARDPLAFWLRLAGVVLVPTYMMFLFWDFREQKQTTVNNSLFFFITPVELSAVMVMTSLVVQTQHAPMMKTESLNGMISMGPMLAAKATTTVAVTAICTGAVSLVAFLFMCIDTQFVWSNFWVYWGFCFMATLTFDFVSLGAALANRGLFASIGIFSTYFFSALLISTVFTRYQDVPWPVRAYFFVGPFSWVLEQLLYLQWRGALWGGAEYCYQANEAGCNYHDGQLPGWKCVDDIDANQGRCFGRSGMQVMTSLGKTWGGEFLIKGEDRTSRDTFILAAQLTFAFLCCVLLARKLGTRKSMTMAPNDTVAPPFYAKCIKEKSTSQELQGTPSEHSSLLPARNNILTFRGLNFQVEVEDPVKRMKTIVENVSGSVSSGQSLTVVGPSGAGKTSVMNLLTCQAHGGKARGKVTLNGTLVDAQVLSRHCCYVAQHESTWGHLTVWESLMYAASLYLGDDTSELERSESAEACLYRMGLDSCRDTRVGDQNFKGISGGQQKRLIVAMALVKRPLVLFVDEPTTGLDAAAAAHTTKYLMEMVEKENIIMVCVMHQPSAAMFETFQDLLVMANGRPAYFGKASDAIPYFDSLGHPVTPGLSSPEFILDLVNADFYTPETKETRQADICRILDNFSEHDVPETAPEELPSAALIPFRRSFQIQFSMRTRMIFDNPVPAVFKMFFNFFWMMVPAVMVTNAYDYTQDTTLSKFRAYLCVMLFACAITPFLSVVRGHEHNQIIYGQCRNGMGNASAFALTSMIHDAVIYAITTPLFVLIGYIATLNAPWESFPSDVVIMYLTILAYEAAAHFNSTEDTQAAAIFGYINFFSAGFMFQGLTISPRQVSWALRWTFYTHFAYFNGQSSVYAGFYWATFSGATNCPIAGTPGCHYHNNDGVPKLPGWKCADDVSYSNCHGATGPQVLESLNSLFQVATETEHLPRNLSIILSFYLMYNLCYVGRLVGNSAKSSSIENDENSPNDGDPIRPAVPLGKTEKTDESEMLVNKS